MIYVKMVNGVATLSTPEDREAVCRWDWKSEATAVAVAAQLTETTGDVYLAVDSGEHVYPRYDVMLAPKIGDDVSYAFNGDSYPCGTITKVSKSFRRIETSDGRVFFRRHKTAKWLNGGWALISGHVNQRNPHF